MDRTCEIQAGGGNVDLFIAMVGDDRLQHWQGGDGTWNATNPQWLNQGGDAPVTWAGNHGVFKNEPGGFDGGTITVEGPQSFLGLQFVDEGYALTGDGALQTDAGGSEIRVLADSAAIATEITGAGGIIKTEAGTLILSGDNTYTGGTTIAGGTLQIASDANLGATSGGLTFNGGTLQNAESVTTARNVTLNAGGGTFQTNADLTVSGTISGSGGGSLTKIGTGVLTLSGTNTYAGGTVINQGEVDAMVAGALGSGPVSVNQARLSFRNSASAGDLAITSNQSSINFYDQASAGAASIINDGGGISFNDDSTAGDATITIKDNGNLDFYGTASAGNATIVNVSGAFLNISHLAADGIAIGSLSGDGSVTLGSKSLTLGGLGKNDAIGGVIQDGSPGSGGSLTKIGTGVLTLAGANTYTGGTDINQGTVDAMVTDALGSGPVSVNQAGLSFRNSASAGDLAITSNQGGINFYDQASAGSASFINDGGGISFNDDSTAGDATITIKDNGNLDFYGTASAGNATIVNVSGAFLNISHLAADGIAIGSLSGDGSVTLGSKSLVLGGLGTNDSIGGVIQDGPDGSGGSVTKIGTGRLTLSGTNTYTGGTAVHQGEVVATVTGALGAGPVSVNQAWLSFADTAGAGDLAIANTRGSIYFRNDSTAENSTITSRHGSIGFLDGSSAGAASITIDGGGISFHASATAGNAGISVREGGALDFYGTASAGNARIRNILGSVRFHGSNTADGATIHNGSGSELDISDLATDGIAIGSVSGDGKIILGSRSLTLGGLGRNDTIGGVIQDGSDESGGSLTKSGSGVLTLTADNTHTGGTHVAAGTLQIGDGGARGWIAGNIEIGADGKLAFNRSDGVTFDGRFSGAGAIEKLADGVLVLTGDSGGFAGTTTIATGTLAVNGRLGGVIDMRSGSRLQGTGTVGTTNVAAGATIAPGNSIGTLTVDGDITFDVGSMYQVEISSHGMSDLIVATGKADLLGGSVFELSAPAYYVPGARYRILTAAGGVSGSYNVLDEHAPFVDLALDYDPNDVYLKIVRNEIPFCAVALTENECSTGGGIDDQGPNGPIHGPVAGVPDEETARSALRLLSGEIHASIKGALLDDSRFVPDSAIDRIRAAFEGVATRSTPLMGYEEGGLVPVAADAPFAAWTRGFGSWGEWDGDGNAADFERSTGGIFVGADALLFDTWRFGLLGGYSHTSFHLADRASSGSSDNYHLGLFAGTQWGDLGFRSGLAYSRHDIETNRMLAFPGFSDQLGGDYGAGTFQAFGELGYRFDAAAFSFEPFAGLAYVNLHTDDFKEDGGAAALAVSSGTTETAFTTLGLRASTEFSLGTMTAAAHGMLGWRHAFGDTTPLSTHAFDGGGAFTIAGVPIAQDAAVIEIGGDLNFTDTASLGLFYNGQIADHGQDHGVTAEFRMKF